MDGVEQRSARRVHNPKVAGSNPAPVTEQIEGLKKALEYSGGTHTLSDLVKYLDEGQVQLWRNDDAVLVTEVQEHPQVKILHFWLATGELGATIELSRKAMAWGREQGCTRATLAGRRGWERALASEGWTADLVLMGREL